MNRPWSVQIEFVEGCNRMCSWCGINGIRHAPGNYKFMSMADAEAISKRCAEFVPTARYEFAMHGEPTVHPNCVELVDIFRQALPDAQLQMTTNGRVWLDRQGVNFSDRVCELFYVGLDFIVLDTYHPERKKLRGCVLDAPTDIMVFDFYLDAHCPSPWKNWHRKLNRAIILMDDISKMDGVKKSRVIYNHAGNAGNPIDEPLQKTCTLPFREISIRYDGAVSLCCQDWGDEYHIGNVVAEDLESLWLGERFMAARRFLRNKMRVFSPCSRCNIGSGSRSHILPKMSLPTNEDLAIVRSVVETSPRINGFPIKLTLDGVA